MKLRAVPCLLFATSTLASSFSVPLTKPRGTGSYLQDLVAIDQARAAFLKHGRQATSAPATQTGYVSYTTTVGIGNPPTYYNLVVDTGSSNTFCGTGTPYVRTSTSIPTGETANVTYGTGNFSGPEYLDQVTLAPNLVITNQSIGDAVHFAQFQGVDGILGVGPVDLTYGTLSPDSNATIPTVMDNLVSQKLINREVLGIYFAPATRYNDTNGVLTYGGADRKLYKGELTYVPVTKTSASSYYWGINITSVTYGNHSIIPKSTAGIVDTGTTLVAFADHMFKAYLKAIPGAKVDANTSLTEIPKSSISKMQPLNFTIGGRVLVLDVAAQLFPTNMNEALGGDPDKYYGTITSMWNSSSPGLEFIMGQKFMERYYAVFDTKNNRVGFAQTNNTFSVYQG